MIKKLKYFIILLLFFTCSLLLQNKVYASIPTMTIDDASMILENFRSGDNYKYKYFYNSSATDTSNINLLTTKANAADLMNIWNNNIVPLTSNNSTSGDTWNDIIFTCFGYSSSEVRIRVLLLGDSTSTGYGKAHFDCGNYATNQYYFSIKPTTGTPSGYRCDIKINSSGMVAPSSLDWFYTSSNGSTVQRINTSLNPISTENNDLSCAFAYTLGQDTKTYYNNGTTEYTLINRPVLTPSEPISGDTESSLGYMFYENENIPALGLNLLSNNNFTTDEYWYIGDDLNFNWNYYYLSGDEKISISGNNLINLNYTNNSGDTGKFYIPTINKINFSNIPNNKDFYLDLYIYYGNDLIYERTHFYSFYTYKQVIDSGQTGTITITNSSGDTSSGEIDLSGIQAGIGDINSSLTNELNLSGETISSGDITSSLGFDLATDPYANFWYNLTTGLSTALSTSVRTISITFQNRTYTINLDDYTTKTPTALKVFFATISTFFVLFGLFKFVKLTINKITSGDVDSLLKSNQNEGITNLF